MDESDYVWRPAFLDEIVKGDRVQTIKDNRPWAVTGTRYEPASGMVSIIGLYDDDTPAGYIAEGYRPVLRREYATPEVPVAPQAPEPLEVARRRDLLEHVYTPVADGGHGAYNAGELSLAEVRFFHDRAHGDPTVTHVHNDTTADHLREADLETEIPSPAYEKLELPHLDGEQLLAHLRADVAPGDSTLPGHEFGDFDLAEVIGQHGSLEGRHDHDHLHNESVELPHCHAPAEAPEASVQTTVIDPSQADTVVIS